MKNFKGRSIDPRRPVFVYRKLAGKGFRKGAPIYSILQDGLVVAHQGRVLLANATFIVRQRGREKVLRERRKNVHAFVKGFLRRPNWRYPFNGAVGTTQDGGKFGIKVWYDPYQAGYFQSNSGEVKAAGAVLLNEHGGSACYIS